MTSITTENQEPVKLFVRKEGNGSPLVFIHGWAASHKFWKHQIKFFSQKYQVIAFDLRGHADSEKPKQGYHVSDHVQDLNLILQTNNVSSPVLVGHSLGGMIALQYYLDQPFFPKALILVGTSPKPVASMKRSIQFSFLRFLIRLSRKRAASFTEKALFGPNVDSELIDWVNAESLRTPTNVILEILQDVKRFDVTHRLSEIQVPVLILIGEFESAVDPRVITQLEETIPRANVQVITDAGHNCMLEQPALFNSILGSFLLAELD